MKMTFDEAVTRIITDDMGKKDLAVPMGWTRMSDDGKIRVGLDEFEMTDYSLSQVFGRVGMPITYEKKLLEEAPELVALQFNHFKDKYRDKTVLLRYREGEDKRTLRAFLSDAYVPLDNRDIYSALGAVLNRCENLEIEDLYLDDGRSRMRIVVPEMTMSAGETVHGVNDIIKVGFDVINSEIGRASLQVSPLVYRLVCTNGLKVWQNDGDVFRQRHSYVAAQELRHMLGNAISTSIKDGDKLISDFIETKGVGVEDPLKVIAEMGKKQQYSEKFIQLTQDNWRIEPDENMFGVINAFTRSAQTMGDETRLEIETFAGSLIKGVN